MHDSQRDTPRVQKLRKAFRKKVQVPLRGIATQLKFIDESGAHLGLTRLFGRATPGTRVIEATPGYSGKHYTLVAALGLGEVSAAWVLEGAMTQDAFETYVACVLAPSLRAGDVVLIDNLNVHKSEVAQSQIAARGARLEFLPPYSPDLNPIEQCWAKVKSVLRKMKARTLDELVEALCLAFESVTPADRRAWFTHCGYVIP
ncbi:MAG: IS630 family transposase [Chloroflexi bacterium]|nr:IS630 family transposase [Chloroflexota bacterium]